jgi:hypothetical protein
MNKPGHNWVCATIIAHHLLLVVFRFFSSLSGGIVRFIVA